MACGEPHIETYFSNQTITSYVEKMLTKILVRFFRNQSNKIFMLHRVIFQTITVFN